MNLAVIFIVGASRSGTTMLSHILGNNNAVLGLNELHFVGSRWNVSATEKWSRARANSEAAQLLATARRSIWDNAPTKTEVAEGEALGSRMGPEPIDPAVVYAGVLNHLASGQGKNYVVDQTPRNIVYATSLLDRFPAARVIHLVRDPRAVLWSQRNRWRQRWIGAPHTPFRNAARVFVNYHPYTASKLWRAAYDFGASLRGHPRYTRLRFEDIVSDPEGSIQELCRFLDIAYDPCMLDVANVGSSHSRHDERKRGVSASNVGAWRGNLPKADTWICEKLTGDAMAELRYEREEIRVPVTGLLLRLLGFPFHAIGVLLFNPKIALRMLNIVSRAG